MAVALFTVFATSMGSVLALRPSCGYTGAQCSNITWYKLTPSVVVKDQMSGVLGLSPKILTSHVSVVAAEDMSVSPAE